MVIKLIVVAVVLCPLVVLDIVFLVKFLKRRKLRAEYARQERIYKDNNNWLVDEFKRCNVCVFGKKGTGKDLLFAHVIYLRKDFCYSNLKYNDDMEVIELGEINLGDNTFKKLLQGNITKLKRRFEVGKDIYISDAGIYFPSQYNSLLDELYPSVPIFAALSRQIGQHNIHLNTQELIRPWNKLREQADSYINVLKTEFKGNRAYIHTITYSHYNSADKGILPPIDPTNSAEERQYLQHQSTFGEIKYKTFRAYKKEFTFDTHALGKKFFDEDNET